MIINLLIPVFRVKGVQRLSRELKAQGKTHPRQDALPFQSPLTPIPLLTQTGTIRHTHSPHLACTSSGCGRKPVYVEETHTDHGECANSNTILNETRYLRNSYI